MEMPSEPSPVMPLMVTVYVVPAPVRPIMPSAVPVLSSVISAEVRLLDAKWASAYVTVNVTELLAVIEADGAPMLTVGAVLSTRNGVLGPAAGAWLPA